MKPLTTLYDDYIDRPKLTEQKNPFECIVPHSPLKWGSEQLDFLKMAKIAKGKNEFHHSNQSWLHIDHFYQAQMIKEAGSNLLGRVRINRQSILTLAEWDLFNNCPRFCKRGAMLE